jgi:ribosomal protein L10
LENLGVLSDKYNGLFVASFSGMTVKEMIDFRTEIRANEGLTKISKNNIVKIFLEKSDDKKRNNF